MWGYELMVFVTVDNNLARLRKMSGMIFKIYPGSVVYEFIDPMLSAKYICNNPVDMVIARINMKPVDGGLLKSVIHKNKPEISVMLLQDDVYEIPKNIMIG